MKKKFDYQWLIWAVIISISVLASNCDINITEQVNEQTTINRDTCVEYPSTM